MTVNRSEALGTARATGSGRASWFGHWFLLRELVRRDFQSRYAGSLLGFAWSFVQPLWQLVLFSFVFSTVLRISPIGERTGSFAIFLFCGLLPWLAIHEGVVRGTTAVTDNAALVKKLRFPSGILVLAVTLTALLHELIAAAVFVGILAALGELSPVHLPWLLPAMVAQVALTLGLALLLAAVNVYLRDVVQVVGMVMTGWFYATPIVYPLGQVPAPYDGWLALNPLTGLVSLYRLALLGGDPSTLPAPWVLALSSAGLLAVGWWTFRRLSPGYVDAL